MTPAAAHQRISPGERAPDFVLPRGGGTPTRFYSVVGGTPAALILGAGGDQQLLRQLLRMLDEAVTSSWDTHLVTTSGQQAADSGGFHDEQGQVHGAYGVETGGPAMVVVLDPNVRVAAVEALDDVERTVAATVEALQGTAHDDDGSTMPRHAPVLLVPDVLAPPMRDMLLQRWASEDTVATGVEMSTGGARGEVADDRHKRRRDHTIEDGQLLRQLTSHIGRRVMPEIDKAFAYRATRFEGFKLGCYEASSEGFFAAHRDNLSPATAHRRFALTLNLNDDYDGGELRFPEYGRQRYRPAAGEALIFSGAHLHEVLPVTRGRRFVLLSFLFSESRAGRG